MGGRGKACVHFSSFCSSLNSCIEPRSVGFLMSFESSCGMNLYERFPLTIGTPKSKSPSATRLTYFKSFSIAEQPGCSSVNVFVGFSNHK